MRSECCQVPSRSASSGNQDPCNRVRGRCELSPHEALSIDRFRAGDRSAYPLTIGKQTAVKRGFAFPTSNVTVRSTEEMAVWCREAWRFCARIVRVLLPEMTKQSTHAYAVVKRVISVGPLPAPINDSFLPETVIPTGAKRSGGIRSCSSAGLDRSYFRPGHHALNTIRSTQTHRTDLPRFDH